MVGTPPSRGMLPKSASQSTWVRRAMAIGRCTPIRFAGSCLNSMATVSIASHSSVVSNASISLPRQQCGRSPSRQAGCGLRCRRKSIAIYIWRERVDLPRDPFPDAQRSARIKADVPQPPPPIAHVEGALAAMEVTHEHRPSRPFQSAHGWITELQESRGHGSTYA